MIWEGGWPEKEYSEVFTTGSRNWKYLLTVSESLKSRSRIWQSSVTGENRHRRQQTVGSRQHFIMILFAWCNSIPSSKTPHTQQVLYSVSIVLSGGAALKKLRIISAAIDGLRLLAALIWQDRTRRKAGRKAPRPPSPWPWAPRPPPGRSNTTHLVSRSVSEAVRRLWSRLVFKV